MPQRNRLLYFPLLAILFLTNCKSTNYLSNVEANRLDVSAQAQLAEDPAILQLIAPYKEKLDVEMGQIIGEAAIDLIKRRPESNLGNWMADAIHRKAAIYSGETIDFALQNYGGIRIPVIKKGPITKGKIYELMPFDNKITIVYLDKAGVEQLIQHFMDANGWPVSYPLKIEQRTKEDIQVTLNGQPLETDRTYRVALPDYIANGGSRSYFLKEKPRKDLNVFIRDILIEDLMDFTSKNESIGLKITSRIITNE